MGKPGNISKPGYAHELTQSVELILLQLINYQNDRNVSTNCCLIYEREFISILIQLALGSFVQI